MRAPSAVPSADSAASAATRRGGSLAVWPVLLVLALLSLRQIGSPDAGFHLARGRVILAAHEVPRFDTLTYTVADHRDVNTSWGYDVLLALVESASGAAGLILLHLVLAVLAFAIVIRTARLAPCDAASLAVLLLLGVLLSEERLEVRPEVGSYVLLALVLHILTRHAETGRARLWALPVLFAIWANVHSLFVVGFAVLVCFNAGAWIRDRRLDRQLAAASVAAAAAVFVTPFGARGVAMALVLATRLRSGHVLHETISEYESPFATLTGENLGLYIVPIVSLFAFVVLVLLSLVPLWRSRRPAQVLLAIAFTVLALAMVRNAPLLAIACLPGAARALPLGSLLQRAGMPPHRAARAGGVVLVTVAAVSVLFGLRVVNDAYYIGRGRLERCGLGWNRFLLPVDAAAYARRAPLPGRMLNDLNFGGHLGHALARPVFIDGRLEVMGEEFFRTWQEAMQSPAAFTQAAHRHGAGWTVFPYRDRPLLLAGLAADPRWRLAYFDHLAAVFILADQAAAAAIDESARQFAAGTPLPLDVATVPGLGRPRRGRLARWLDGFVHRQSYPVADYALGVFHYLCGEWRGLASYSAAGLRASGGAHRELYANLGSALYALGDLEPARRCLAIAVAEVPPYRRAERENLRRLLSDVESALAARGARRRP